MHLARSLKGLYLDARILVLIAFLYSFSFSTSGMRMMLCQNLFNLLAKYVDLHDAALIMMSPMFLCPQKMNWSLFSSPMAHRLIMWLNNFYYINHTIPNSWDLLFCCCCNYPWTFLVEKVIVPHLMSDLTCRKLWLEVFAEELHKKDTCVLICLSCLLAYVQVWCSKCHSLKCMIGIWISYV